MVRSKFAAVSLRPGDTSQKRSVLAVHMTITLSRPALERKSRMSLRICSSCGVVVWRLEGQIVHEPNNPVWSGMGAPVPVPKCQEK